METKQMILPVWFALTDSNRTATSCRQCGSPLAAGQGHQVDRMPVFVPGFGRYLCQDCSDLWSTWFSLNDKAVYGIERVRYWINTSLPNAPILAEQNGITCYMDQQALAHLLVKEAIETSGLAYASVAHYLAENLERLDRPVDRLDDLMHLVNSVRRIVLTRISQTIRIPFRSE